MAKILFNGCSMVEMGNLDADLDWRFKSWPYLLSKKLDIDCVNIGKTMSSNYRIFRTTIDYLIINSDIDIVFIGWTNADRIELALSNGDFVKMTPHGSLADNSVPNDIPYHKDYYKNHYNDWIQHVETVRIMYTLEQLCRYKNIKLWNINSVFHNHINQYNDLLPYNFYYAKVSKKYRDPLQHKKYREEFSQVVEFNKHIINMNWVLPYNQTLIDLCRLNSFPMDTWGHPMIGAQENIANNLFKNINDIQQK